MQNVQLSTGLTSFKGIPDEPKKPGYTPWLTNGEGEITWKKDNTPSFIKGEIPKSPPKPLSSIELLKFEMTVLKNRTLKALSKSK